MPGVDQDAKGNQTFIPSILRRSDNSLTLSWDFENKLTSADTGADGEADVTYQWDALLRRVARTAEGETTVFAPSGQQTVADYRLGAAPATAKHTYVFGSYIDEPIMRGGEGGLRFFHRNQQYSVVALTDGGGGVVERYAYSAYGEPTFFDGSGVEQESSTENNRYTYTGREWDEALSLYHYRARMYGHGRFVSRDPIGFYGSKWGQYNYVAGAAISKVDPSGLHERPPRMSSNFTERQDCAQTRFEQTPGALYVTCRRVRGIGGLFVRHCHYASDCKAGYIRNEHDDLEWLDCYPIWRSTSPERYIYDRFKRRPRGKPCSLVTDKEIYECLTNGNSVGAGDGIGSNCQTDTHLALSRCCLSSCWRAAWYGTPENLPIPPTGVPPKRNRCARGHWEIIEVPSENGSTYSDRVWICDEYFPDFYESDMNGQPWIPPHPIGSPWNPIIR